MIIDAVNSNIPQKDEQPFSMSDENVNLCACVPVAAQPSHPPHNHST